MSYHNQLKQFLAQAKTENLKTNHFDSSYKEFDVKVSFGKGNTARIPWISFLKKPHTTSNGIYPVYLYYKDRELIILAYGISETHIPKSKWKIEGKQTITDYFETRFSKKPDRYGASYVFKVYECDNLPSDLELDNDLNSILAVYLDEFKNVENISIENGMINIDSFVQNLKLSGLLYSDQLIQRFTASLLTKPFVILTGLSGSGKTKLAQAFVQWICQDKRQYRIIPVGADWTNREPLLGYPNTLNPKEYVTPDSGVDRKSVV